MRKVVLLTGAAMALVALSVASAKAEETKPAIADINGKVDFSGGDIGGDANGSFAGTVGLPLAHAYGMQMDVGATKGEGVKSGGAAAHIFRRDPDAYMIGLTGMAVLVDREKEHQIYRTGVESEFYMGDFTVAPSAGYQRNFGENWAYADLQAQYYLTDNLVLGAGVGGYSDYRSVSFDVESQPFEDTPMSLFASVGAGNKGAGFGIVGVRFSFGMNGVSLKRQHREYDPPNIVNSFVSGASGGGAIFNKVEKVETAPAPVVHNMPN